MKDFVRFIGQKFDKLVTGIIMEFEDTFPFEGNLKPLRGGNFYTRD